MIQKLKDEMNEVIRLITIERKLERTKSTLEEINFVRELADKKRYPRAEYVLARMYISGQGVSKDKTIAMKYLARSSRYASYDLQLKIAYTYHMLGEYKKIKKCLEHAIEDCKWMK